MVDHVIIDGIVRPGNIPDWATETTLFSIDKRMQNSNKLLGILTKKGETDNAILDEIRQLAGDLAPDRPRPPSAGDRQIAGAVEENTRANKQQMEYLQKSIVSSFKSVIFSVDSKSLFGSISGGLKSTGDQLKYMKFPLAGAVIGLGLITEGFNFLYHKLEDTNKSLISLYSTGLLFDNGMQGLIDAADTAGLSVDKFASILTQHAAAAASLGTKRLVEVNKMFMDSTKGGADLMMTQEEASNAFLDSVELIRGTGKLTKMSNEEITKSGRDLIKNYNELAEATGQNRDEIAKNTNAIMKLPDVSVLARIMPDPTQFAKTMSSFSAQFGASGNEMASMAAQIKLAGGSMATLPGDMATIVNQVPGLYQALREAGEGDPEAATRARQAIGNLDPRKVADLMVKFPEAGKQLDTWMQSTQTANDIEQLRMKKDAKTLSQEEANRLKNYEDAKRRLETQNRLSAATARMQNSFSHLALSLENIVLPVVDALAYGFDKLSGVIQWVSKGFNSLFGNSNTDNQGNAIAPTGSATIAAILTTGAVLMIVKKVLPTAMSWMMGAGGSLLSRFFRWGSSTNTSRDIAGQGGGMGRMLGGLGRALSGLGRGVGTVVKSVLTGVGEGLSALGKPNVLKGVAALLGISAAVWVAAKAFKEFNTVEWGSMGKAIVAITGVGVAAAVAGNQKSQIIGGGIALGLAVGAIGAGLWVAAKGLRIMQEIDWQTMAKAGVGIVALGAAALFAGPESPLIAVGGIALGIAIGAIGLGLIQAGRGLQLMQEINWQTMAKAAVALGGIIALSAGAGAVSPLILAGSLALTAAATSLTGFATLDGNALSAVGQGMGGLALGLVQLTGGELIKGLGGLVNGLLGLFQEDPVEKLKRFASVGEPLKVTAEALKLLADSMPMAIRAIESLSKVDFSGIDKLKTAIDILQRTQSGGILSTIGNFVGLGSSPTPQTSLATIIQAGASAGTNNLLPTNTPGEVQPVRTVQIDAAAEYYDKSMKQFQRMIELLEIANDYAKRSVDINDSGFDRLENAISSSGRLF